MNKFIEQVKAFWADEDGLSAVEYVVAGALIVGGLAAAFGGLGDAIKTKVGNIETCIETSANCPPAPTP